MFELFIVIFVLSIPVGCLFSAIENSVFKAEKKKYFEECEKTGRKKLARTQDIKFANGKVCKAAIKAWLREQGFEE